MKIFSIVLALLLTGCASTVEMKKGKVYIRNENLPTVTNDRNYEQDKKQTHFILVRKGIFYYYIVRF